MIRHLEFDDVLNFRDIGGYRGVDDRTVRWQTVYRSGTLHRMTAADLDRFRALGVRTVIDLRYPWEIEQAGGRVSLTDLGYHNLSIEHRPYDQASLGDDVEVVPFLADRFAEVTVDGVKEIRKALETVAGDPLPAVIHCAAGKDRTGILIAIVLALLGVSDDDIVADFALTERATEQFIARWRARNPDAPRLWPGYGQAPAALMRRFLDDLNATHGSVHEYAVAKLGVEPDLIDALRERLLD